MFFTEQLKNLKLNSRCIYINTQRKVPNICFMYIDLRHPLDKKQTNKQTKKHNKTSQWEMAYFYLFMSYINVPCRNNSSMNGMWRWRKWRLGLIIALVMGRGANTLHPHFSIIRGKLAPFTTIPQHLVRECLVDPWIL